jgi:hypothetical protein
MSRWVEIHSPATSGNKDHKGTNQGLRRVLANLKRNEAEFRNTNTPHDRTRAHRLNRCDCA